MPPSVVRKIPLRVVATTVWVWVGWMANPVTRRFKSTVMVRPVVVHVCPPSTVFNTPMEYVSPASRSPVPMYMVSGFRGSMAMALTPKLGSKSVLVDQVAPLSSERHKPPAGAPANSRFGTVG